MSEILVIYPECSFLGFIDLIAEEALRKKVEVAGVWLGYLKPSLGNRVEVLALIPVLLNRYEAGPAHARIPLEHLISLEKAVGEKLGTRLLVTVIVHTHNWPGGAQFFSSLDKSTAEQLRNPYLIFAVVDPYSKEVSHYAVEGGDLRKVEYRLISYDPLVFDGQEVAPASLSKGLKESEQGYAELLEEVRRLSVNMLLLAEKSREFSEYIEYSLLPRLVKIAETTSRRRKSHRGLFPWSTILRGKR